MHLIRPVETRDISQLLRLARLMQLINLPYDEKELRHKCAQSQRSFSGKEKKIGRTQYMFVLEDTATKRIIGTSSLIGQHGTPDEPHMYFLVDKKTHRSKTTRKTITHPVLRFKFETHGPTEIAGLVMDPWYRKSEEKLGRFLSFVRFLYMGIYPKRFRQEVLAELLPPFLSNGSSLLWEAVGKKFTQMEYHVADRLSRRNKEFVTSLFPQGDIYIPLLPGNVQDIIGQVGPETAPVRHMLEKIGFRYTSMVDPFDGGPHYWADRKKISLIRKIRRLKIGIVKNKVFGKFHGIVSHEGSDFRALQSSFVERNGSILLTQEEMDALRCLPHHSVWCMPYP